jgi:hypothetical protein
MVNNVYIAIADDGSVIAYAKGILNCLKEAFNRMPYDTGVAPYYVVYGTVLTCSQCGGSGTFTEYDFTCSCSQCGGTGMVQGN